MNWTSRDRKQRPRQHRNARDAVYRVDAAMNVFWFLPTHGDGHFLGTPDGGRAITFAYLRQIAQAADDLGFGGVLLPTGSTCEDAWITAATLVPETQRLRFLVAVRPGIPHRPLPPEWHPRSTGCRMGACSSMSSAVAIRNSSLATDCSSATTSATS
jgi:hypothetical protein